MPFGCSVWPFNASLKPIDRNSLLGMACILVKRTRLAIWRWDRHHRRCQPHVCKSNGTPYYPWMHAFYTARSNRRFWYWRWSRLFYSIWLHRCWDEAIKFWQCFRFFWWWCLGYSVWRRWNIVRPSLPVPSNMHINLTCLQYLVLAGMLGPMTFSSD